MQKKYYFASDFHLGAPNREASAERERKIVSWLDEIKTDCEELFILGDVFDFWFEYKTVIPRGYVRLLGKLAELSDSGITIHWFIGNHDMWIFDYIPDEIGAIMHTEPIERQLYNARFYIGHGDGLGPGDYGYKFIKKIFRSKFSQWLFARFHPNFGIGLANFFSASSRKSSQESDKKFLGKDGEWLAIYCEELQSEKLRDFYVFGHRHLPMRLKLDKGGEYINIGDWITHFTYGVYHENGFELKAYQNPNPKIYSNKE